MARLFDADPITKTKQFFHYDATTGDFFLETRQDVTACVELTKAEFAAMDERAPWKGDMVLAGRIPMSIVGELQRQGIWYDDVALKKWLDDSANLDHRARPGRLSK